MIARDKTSLVGRAREAKVEIAVFYDTPVQPLEGLALRDVLYEPGSCPRAEQLSAQVVSLPTGLQVTDAQIKRSVDFLNSAA
jgi:dTDP-4-amino-4,6-dideoxygalactose transaminase